MNKILAGSFLYIVGLASCIVALAWTTSWTEILVAVGAVLMVAGGAVLLASRRGAQTPAAMRLNWFLPFFRKRSKEGPQIRRPSWLRKTLQRIGPSVVASPLRRAIQVTSLTLFLTLFYYVCWPYTAQPCPPSRECSGWKLAEIDQATGSLQFSHPAPPEWTMQRGRTVHVVDENALGDDDGYVGEFRIVAAAPSQPELKRRAENELDNGWTESSGSVELVPAASIPAPGAESLVTLTPEQFDQIITSQGPWRLCDRRPGQWPSHYADDLERKEVVSADLFLVIDPLVALSTAIAARSWIWSLTSAAVILIICLLIPRGFCGYICPLGTTIDLFDWIVGRRVTRWRVSENGWWVHIKYYLLAGILVSALMGVLISGFFAAIPVITRAMLFITEPLQTGTLRDWYLIPSMNAGQFLSIVLFIGVLALGLLRPRFWCRYVCPSGALFSASNLFRITERKVETSCIHCNKCVEICPFDAIKSDFTTRGTDCTFCQSCGGVCPTHAIKFVERWNRVDLKVEGDPATGDTRIGRRGFLSLAAGSTAALVGGIAAAEVTKALRPQPDDTPSWIPVRPPGSVPEQAFLQMCIRCGECFKVCPNNVLQSEGFQQGLEGLWTPIVVADWAGCEPSCNACGQVCPTGAIRALALNEKRVARIGLAVVDTQTCLPFADRDACQLCVDECNAAGYDAIEFMQVNTRVDSDGLPIEGTGYLAPVVSAEKCVGCGICQTRCYGINVKATGLLDRSAIVIEAGPGKEDRLITGSYRELRAAESRERESQRKKNSKNDYFVPETDSEKEAQPPESEANPFG